MPTDSDIEKRRDEILKRLLRTPPQPKPQKGSVNQSPRKKGGKGGGDRRPSKPSKG